MTIFPYMPSKLRAAPAALVLLLIASAAFGKSPEDFVGPAPAPAPANQKPSPNPKPTANAVQPAPASAKAAAAKPGAGKPAAAKTMMDTAALHATYLDGDFDQAIRTMESALKSKKSNLSHSDSVFIFKHLGVMYAATPATREKGRYYMAQLIYIEPTAKILDMYASDMIYLIFRNVQEEFANRHPNVANPVAVAVDTTPKPVQPAAPSPAAPVARTSSSNRKTVYWVAGGAIAVGAIGLLYVLLDNPAPKHNSIVLPE